MEILEKERNKKINWTEDKVRELLEKESLGGLSETEENEMNYHSGYINGILSFYERIYGMLNRMDEKYGE